MVRNQKVLSKKGPLPMSQAERWKRRAPLLPALIFTLLLTQFPFFLTLLFSIQNWMLLSGRSPEVNWGANYLEVAKDEVFWKATGNTLIMTIGTTILCLIFGLLLAMVLNHNFPGKGIARTLAITPFFVMPVAVTLFWKSAMFDPSFGLLGFISRSLNLPAISWLSEYPMAAIVLILTWRFAPFAMLILLAGLQSTPADQIEAAQMDGAGPLRRFVSVLLPHLRQFVELTALLLIMNIIQTFGEIAMLTAGGPAYATTNITYYVYLKGFEAFNFGQASALGVVALIFTIALIQPMLKLLKGIFQTEVK